METREKNVLGRGHEDANWVGSEVGEGSGA